MRQITRITVAYDAREDRLRLAARDRENQPLILWLTQRLADRVVKALVAALDKTVENEAPQGAATPAAMPATQLWQQTTADLQMKGSAPVIAPPAISEEGLVESASLRIAGKRFELELNWPEGSATLPMDMVYLRQLLRIVHRHYQKGGWLKAGVWPDWFADNAHQTLIGSNQVN